MIVERLSFGFSVEVASKVICSHFTVLIISILIHDCTRTVYIDVMTEREEEGTEVKDEEQMDCICKNIIH